jgi:hypothetical protein
VRNISREVSNDDDVKESKQNEKPITRLLVRESELETSFRGINDDDPRPCLPIEAEQLVFDDSRGVDGIVQSTNGSSVSSWKAVLDVVKGGVNEEVGVSASSRTNVPGARFNANSITDGAELLKLPICDDNSVFAEKGNLTTVWRPYNVLNLGSSKLSKDTPTLHLEKHSTIVSTKNDTTRCTSIVKTVHIGHWCSNTLCSFIVHVLHNNLTLMTVENSETVASKKNSRSKARSPLTIRNGASSICERERNELITSSINLGTHENISFLRVVHVVRKEARPGSYSISLGLLTNPTKTGNRNIHTRGSPRGTTIIMAKELTSTNVVQLISWPIGRRRTFPL